ncbi:MAG: sigma-54 dependent transcriptional regulator [Candidatus Zixiibacteriota bacterium]
MNGDITFQNMAATRLLMVDDESDQRQLLAGFLSRSGYEITQAGSGEEALERYPGVFAPVALIDMKMPGMTGLELLARLRELNPLIQVIVLTAFGSVETAVAAMRAGAYDYLTKPVEDLNELLVKLEKATAQNRLVVDNQIMQDRIADVFPASELLGESQAINKVRELIKLVAPREATVLVTGASGTGKELVARVIHALSPRSDKRLVAINCAAFPETLLEAELFGYEKGAFTGADKPKQGRFELADGGTLFLDEIGEMPQSMQVKLLRVLEDRHIQRLGSVKEISLDIRIIAATNRDLDNMVRELAFREDLFYRLNVVRIQLPSLAERPGDTLLLAHKFLEKFSRRLGKQIDSITPDAAAALAAYSWPGNVRELENVIERAVVLSTDSAIDKNDLTGLAPARTGVQPREVRPLGEIEREHIQFCLDQLDWNLGLCAERLGIHRNTLRSKIKEYQLSPQKLR